MTINPVSVRDAARLVYRVRRALECGIGDVRSNETVHGLLAIAEQWVEEQGEINREDLSDLSQSEGNELLAWALSDEAVGGH